MAFVFSDWLVAPIAKMRTLQKGVLFFFYPILSLFIALIVSFLFQENILLRQKGQSAIKVIDFGSSCYEHQKGNT